VFSWVIGSEIDGGISRRGFTVNENFYFVGVSFHRRSLEGIKANI